MDYNSEREKYEEKRSSIIISPKHTTEEKAKLLDELFSTYATNVRKITEASEEK